MAIERQVSLPFRKSLEISWQNIVHRFGRCAVTVAGIALGVAFLCYILGDAAVTAAIARTQEYGEPPDRSVQVWLVSISLLTCVVGVTNAMLMSVTERYKEIGTMKCLGALDSFVVRLFLWEAGFQGATGAVIGWLIAFLLALLRTLTRFGMEGLRVFPLVSFLGIFGIAVGAGMVLSILGALYPAWRAGKMPPAEAMRVEV